MRALRGPLDNPAVAENLTTERANGIARFEWEDLAALRILAAAMGPALSDDRYIAWQYERNPFTAEGRRPLFLHMRAGRVEEGPRRVILEPLGLTFDGSELELSAG